MFTNLFRMDSISAPTPEGTYQTVFGRACNGLFLQRLGRVEADMERFCFRHEGSGLSLFYFLGSESSARQVLERLSELYDFQRDSSWVLKTQSEINRHLQVSLRLSRRWLYRAWHYSIKGSQNNSP